MRVDLTRRAPWLLALAVYAMAPSVLAQTVVTPKGDAQNVRFEQREEGVVHIFYDLISSDPRGVFAVRLEASSDGGATFGIRPQSATGDVGTGVTPGVGKRIVWESAKDVERLQLDRYRFRIVATGGPLQGAPAQPVSTAKEPVRTAKPATVDPPAQPATKPPAAPAPKKGGSGKWIAIAGGAGAAAAVAAASGGGGGGGGSGSSAAPVVTPNRAPVVTQSGFQVDIQQSTALATATSYSFFVDATDADGDVITAVWNFGDGSNASGSFSNGRSTANKVFNNAGAFTPGVTVSDSRGGTATSSTSSITVGTLTGVWAATFDNFPGSGFFTFGLNQNGNAVSGNAVRTDGLQYRVTGTVSGPRHAKLAFTDPSGGAYETELDGNADLRLFRGTATILGGLTPFTMTKQ